MTVRRLDTVRVLVRGYVVMPDGTKRPYSKTLRNVTLRDAELWESKHVADILAGRIQLEESRSPTLAEFQPDFLRYCRVEKANSVNELANKESWLRTYLVPFFGTTRLDEIDMGQLVRFKEFLGQATYGKTRRDGTSTQTPLHPKTQNNILACLGTLLRVAVELKALQVAPRVTLLEVEDAQADHLDFEELPRAVAAANGMWAKMVLLAAKTGLRQGELVALRWGAVDLAKGWLSVRRTLDRERNEKLPKSGEVRDVPIPAGVLRVLAAYRETVPHGPGDLVFPAPDGGHLTASGMRGAIRRIGKRAGITRDRPKWYLGWHDLRHTYASHLLMRGVSVFLVSRYLGHADISITQKVYAHVIPKEGGDAVAVIDDCSGLAESGARVAAVRNLQVERGLRAVGVARDAGVEPSARDSASPGPASTFSAKTRE